MSGVGVGVDFAPRVGLFCCCFGCCFCCAMERACDAAPSAIKTITVKIETRFKRESSKAFSNGLPLVLPVAAAPVDPELEGETFF
jgi:hypothetical protein